MKHKTMASIIMTIFVKWLSNYNILVIKLEI